MVGSKVLWNFYGRCKCTASAECKTNQLVMLTVESGLDPHMIIELEDGLKLCYLVLLAICLRRILPLCLICVGIYLYLSNQVLINLTN
jgi:hypothetical protein